MCASIRHRGPDGDGFYFGDSVALGMRRLAIIDVQAGSQPIHNEDKSVWVVFNGEIYNYRELRHALEKRNHQFSTWSDTECLVHLYEDFGDECVQHLRGMFSFAIWDDRSKRLLVARDRLGIKPLYYRQNGENVAFASELKCLLVDNIERQIDLSALSDFSPLAMCPDRGRSIRACTSFRRLTLACGAPENLGCGDTGRLGRNLIRAGR